MNKLVKQYALVMMKQARNFFLYATKSTPERKMTYNEFMMVVQLNSTIESMEQIVESEGQ